MCALMTIDDTNDDFLTISVLHCLAMTLCYDECFH